MGLRDILKKKDELEENVPQPPPGQDHLDTPEFVFVRSDTSNHEVIRPPEDPDQSHLAAKETSKARRSLDIFRPRSRSRSASVSSQVSTSSPRRDGAGRRLSQRLHLHHEPKLSEYVPDNLPAIGPTDPEDKDAAESQWEKRATILAGQNERARSRPSTPVSGDKLSQLRSEQRSRSNSVSPQSIDEDIQTAISLHESGDLERSTQIFGRLADPNGANNPLSQVLYGLALR